MENKSNKFKVGDIVIIGDAVPVHERWNDETKSVEPVDFRGRIGRVVLIKRGCFPGSRKINPDVTRVHVEVDGIVAHLHPRHLKKQARFQIATDAIGKDWRVENQDTHECVIDGLGFSEAYGVAFKMTEGLDLASALKWHKEAVQQ